MICPYQEAGLTLQYSRIVPCFEKGNIVASVLRAPFFFQHTECQEMDTLASNHPHGRRALLNLL